MNTRIILGMLVATLVLFGVSMWSVYYEQKYLEAFQPGTNANPKTDANTKIILLGDSVLQNKRYVEQRNSVPEILRTILSKDDKYSVFCYASDGSTITDTYQQLREIPIEFNNSNTFIFLSSGGNDIIDKAQSGSTDENIDLLFQDYIKLVDSIKTKMNESNIVLLNLYYPENKDYHLYYGIIKDWNNKLDVFAKESHLKVLKINLFMRGPEDFVSNIEPSGIGGEKIAVSIKDLVI